jgi:hypothetical protein
VEDLPEDEEAPMEEVPPTTEEEEFSALASSPGREAGEWGWPRRGHLVYYDVGCGTTGHSRAAPTSTAGR